MVLSWYLEPCGDKLGNAQLQAGARSKSGADLGDEGRHGGAEAAERGGAGAHLARPQHQRPRRVGAALHQLAQRCMGIGSIDQPCVRPLTEQMAS